MKVSIFGNPDLTFDSLPIQIMPYLEKIFPSIDFVREDPNELDLPTEKKMIFIDTIRGLKKVRIVTSSEIAKTNPRATAHDFDLTTHILLVKKINKNIDIKIIGIPMEYTKEKALEDVEEVLKKEIQKSIITE